MLPPEDLDPLLNLLLGSLAVILLCVLLGCVGIGFLLGRWF
jgi:hypothetical protein